MSLESPAPDPREARTAAEFATQLRRLKAWSGRTYRQLEREAARRGDALPHSTIATALNRGSLPRTELVEALVAACGCDDDTVAEWVAARQRLATGEVLAAPTRHGDDRHASLPAVPEPDHPAAADRVEPPAGRGTAVGTGRRGRPLASRRLRASLRRSHRLVLILLALFVISASSRPVPDRPVSDRLTPNGLAPNRPAANGSAPNRSVAPPASAGPADLPVPAAWWRFEETGPIALDSSGHGVNAVIRGGVTRTAAPGGHALRLDGSGHAETAGPVIRTDTAFTITAWVRLDTTGDWGTVVAEHHGTRDPDVLLLDYDEQHTDWALMMPDRVKGWAMGDDTVFSGLTPVAGRWTHLAAVFDPADRRVCLWVNGSLEACRTRDAITRASGPLDIGQARLEGRPADGWHGVIDDVRVFARTLTGEEIANVVAHRA